MTIGEIARRAGLRASTIRYYESVGLLPVAARVARQRQYDQAILERLAVIRFARHVGLSLGEIRQLVGGRGPRPSPERWHQIADQKLRALDELILDAQRLQRLLRQTLASQCPRLAERGLALGDRGADDPNGSEPPAFGILSARSASDAAGATAGRVFRARRSAVRRPVTTG